MTEEVKKTEDVTKPEPYVPKDKWEEKAIASGKWKPFEEWEGEPDDWRPAREYIERGELFDKIEEQKKEVKQLRKVLDTLKDHHLKVKQEAMEEAIASLNKERAKAKKDEDIGRVIELSDEIDTLKEKQKKAIEKAKQELEAATPIQGEPSPAFKEWHKDNSWYKLGGKDAMSVFANVTGDEYLRSNPRATEQDVLEYVQEAVRKEFPDKFKAPKIDPKVEGSGNSRPTTVNGKRYNLTEQERQVGETLVKSGVLTWDQYVKDLEGYDKGRK